MSERDEEPPPGPRQEPGEAIEPGAVEHASGPARSGVLAPFSVPAFRFQWPGDLATAVAIEMEVVILGWYVLAETGSIILLSLFGALHFFGTLSAPLIGVVGDRMGLRPLLVVMRGIYTLITLATTALALSGHLTPLAVFVMSSVIGLVRPSDMSVRTAIVAKLMPARLLTGAVGISRSTGDVARILGALTGATLFAFFGLGNAYLCVLSLYATGLVLTWAAGRYDRKAQAATGAGVTRRSPLAELAAGLGYVWRTPHLNGGMWLAVLANLTLFPLTGGLLPYVARDVLGLDSRWLGLLVASFATGALLGSLTIGALGRRLRLGRTMLVGCAIWHVLILGFAHSPGTLSAGMFLLLAGFAQSLSIVSLAAMLLRTCAPEYVGRVMGVRMLATYSLPIGLVVLGALIARAGFSRTVSVWIVLGLALNLAIAIHWRAALWHPSAPANQR